MILLLCFVTIFDISIAVLFLLRSSYIIARFVGAFWGDASFGALVAGFWGLGLKVFALGGPGFGASGADKPLLG